MLRKQQTFQKGNLTLRPPSLSHGEILSPIRVRSLDASDTDWIRQILVEHWSSVRIVSRGKVHNAELLPGLVALLGSMRVGLLTYRIDVDQCEIVTINSLQEGIGIGTALIKSVRSAAVANGCRRLWVITTNDNVRAIGFYRRNGFSLVARHRYAVEQSRKLKPEIPLIGLGGIPLRDEIELEMVL